MKATFYRNDFKILSDDTDCFEDMLVSQLNVSKKMAENITEITVTVDEIVDICEY